MRRLLREPLLHFLILGAALFTAYGLINGRGDGKDSIIVTAAQIDHLATGFTRSWRRPPTADELQDLVSNYVREEIYYREAKQLALDRDDPIIRRRLQQKLEFVLEDATERKEPSDADLSAFLSAHPERFRVGRTVTFTQIYFDPANHADAENTATELLGQLNAQGTGQNTSTLGDRFVLGAAFDALPVSEIAKLFGQVFAEGIAKLDAGTWEGPIKSGYGTHLVLVQERTSGRVPGLDEVREKVSRDWKETQRVSANEAAYRRLLSRYSVMIGGQRIAEDAPKPLLARQ
jgi:PPIC-type PPIASE domain